MFILQGLKNFVSLLNKNDELVQDGESNAMLWKIDELIAYVSQYFTLKKGDLLFTGTPADVGSVAPEDVLVGTLEGKENFSVKIK